jgi:hypothetical protein
MDSPRMIVVHVGLKHTVEMPLVEHDDMIERVSTDAANDPLAVGARQPFVRNGPQGFLTNRVGREREAIRALESMVVLSEIT